MAANQDILDPVQIFLLKSDQKLPFNEKHTNLNHKFVAFS